MHHGIRLVSTAHVAHRRTGGLQFRDVEDTIGSRWSGCEAVEFFVVRPECKTPIRLEQPLDHGHYLPGGDIARVGDVVGAERGASLPQIQAGMRKIASM